MALLSFDDLMVLAQETPLLCEAEERLRQQGKRETADLLEKLVQDAGVQMDPMFGVEPPAGPETAALYGAYQPVDHDRFNAVMAQCARHLDDNGIKQRMEGLSRDILRPSTRGPAPGAGGLPTGP